MMNVSEMMNSAEKFDNYNELNSDVCYVSYGVDNDEGGRDYYRNRFYASEDAIAFVKELLVIDNAHFIGIMQEYGVQYREFLDNGFNSCPYGYTDNFDLSIYHLADGTPIMGTSAKIK